ncbi:MAG: hypothetical protein AAF585_02995, partial [Verrucomicrobiota bacterium]
MSDELFVKALVASLDNETAAADLEDFAERLKSSDEDLEAFVEAQRFEQEMREATIRRAQEVTAFDAIHDDWVPHKPSVKPTPTWVWPIVSAAAAFVVGVFGSWMVFDRIHGGDANVGWTNYSPLSVPEESSSGKFADNWTQIGHIGRDHGRCNSFGEITASAGANPFANSGSSVPKGDAFASFEDTKDRSGIELASVDREEPSFGS